MKTNGIMNRIAISGTEYPHRPIEELYRMAKYLGVKNLELWIPHNFKYDDLEKVKRELDQKGFKAICISTWTQLNLPGDVTERQNLIIQSIHAAKLLGSSLVNTYFGANPTRTDREAIKAYQESIEPCLELAIKEDVTIVLENEFDITGKDTTRSAEKVLELVKSVDSKHFRLNFDLCNFYFAGEEPYPYAYRLLKDYIGYIHIKDGTKYHEELYNHPGEGFLWQDKSGDYICTELGKGGIPYESFFRQLIEDDYQGYLTMEPHVHPTKLREIFKANIQNTINFITEEM